MTVSWNDQGIVGVKRFLDKVWRSASLDFSSSAGEGGSIHKLIKKITEDVQQFKFNTAIAAFMEFMNNSKQMSRENFETFLVLLAPFAPHITEEIWHNLGHKDSIHLQAWPKFDEALIKETTVTVVIQILGRVRASLTVPAGSTQEFVKNLALQDETVKKYLTDKEIIKEIFVPNKLINFVIK
jgi:leucyl-tRNA synthetase